MTISSNSNSSNSNSSDSDSSAGDSDFPSSGTVTFLFSDVEGSTALWEQQPQAMSAALLRHDSLMQAAIDGAGGTVFKTAGDAFHAVFAQPEAALRAAWAVQAALHAEAWPLADGRQIRVRLALHTGEAEQRGGDYFGAALSRTSRLLKVCHGGQTLLSEAAAALISSSLASAALISSALARGGLPPEVRLRSLGRHRFRDLAAAQEVFELLAPGLPLDLPALRSLEALPNNLPAQLTSFIGREQEMAAARTQLAGTRLLTLTGVGGSGKTRLALQAAAEALGRYAGGVWLVELAALTDSALIVQAIAAALGVREDAGRLRQAVADTLRPQPVLLVLDNCEHLVEEAARLTESLLQACPS